MHFHQRPPCTASKPSARVNGSQTIIVIVVLVLGSALARTGMPVILVAEVLTTCGLIGAHLARRPASATETP